jgi:septum site-determining protein MinC
LDLEISPSSLVELKGSTVPAIRVVLRSVDPDQVRAALEANLGASPGFFEDELALVDLAAVEDEGQDVDWHALGDALGAHGLRLGAVSNAAGGLRASATAAGLAVVTARAPVRPRAAERQPEPAPAPAEAAPPPAPPGATTAPSSSVIIDKPLRSGQQVYARGADAVLLAVASAGSEVIADGSVHVYAPLRGRALAGARGDTEARIFTTSFEAELVSIAGVYRTFEQGIPADIARRPAQVSLVLGSRGEQSLTIQPLSVS